MQEAGVGSQGIGCPLERHPASRHDHGFLGEIEGELRELLDEQHAHPESAIDFTIGIRRRKTTGARPSDISSMSRMRGFAANARASTTICCSPPDSRAVGASMRFSSSGNCARAASSSRGCVR